MAGKASKENGKKGGRPKGSVGGHTIEASKAREYLVKRITQEMEPIVTAQVEAAKGMWIEGEDGRIYQKAPDLKAGEYLLNQSVGKPKETMEVDNKVTLKLDV